MIARSRLVSVGIALLITTSLWAQDASPSDPVGEFGETVDVEVINVDVRVYDDGDPVTGLGRGDFVLRVNGEDVEISQFYAVESSRRQPSTEGVAPAVETRAEPVEPHFLVVLVDDLHLSPFSRNRRLEELAEFLRDRADTGHRVMIARGTNIVETITPFTDDPDVIEEGIETLQAMSSYGAQAEQRHLAVIEDMLIFHDASMSVPDQPLPCPKEMGAPARAYFSDLRAQARASIRAIEDLSASLISLPGRKAMLLVSDGLPAQPGAEVVEWVNVFCGGGSSTEGLSGTANNVQKEVLSSPDQTGLLAYNTGFDITSNFGSHYGPIEVASDSSASNTLGMLDDAIAKANASGVTIFSLEAIGPRSLGAQMRSDQRASTGSVERARVAALQDGLNKLAVDTGGRALFNVADLEPYLDDLLEEFDTYYSLGFSYAHAAGDPPLTIDVDVRGGGVNVRHRRSFMPRALADQIHDRTLGALNFDLEANPMKVALEVDTPRSAGGDMFMVPLRIRIPMDAITLLPEGDDYRAQLSLYVAARDRAGRTAPVRQQEIPVTIPKDKREAVKGKLFSYTLEMLMRPGDHTVAIGVHDDVGKVGSFLVEYVPVTVRRTATMD